MRAQEDPVEFEDFDGLDEEDVKSDEEEDDVPVLVAQEDVPELVKEEDDAKDERPRKKQRTG